MSKPEKNILNRFYFVAGFMFFLAVLIAIKLADIQFVEGDKYRELAAQKTTKNVIIPANRGNVYADDGSLLASSVPKYDIRFDAVTVSKKDFDENLVPLSKALSGMFDKPASYYQNLFRKARSSKNRYLLVARDLGYSQYIQVKKMPLFKKGGNRGGFIAEQKTVREHPMGKIAERLVGNENKGTPGYYGIGLEGAYHEYLSGKEGRRLKQKISKGRWKPVNDDNEIEPQDGYDVISTINVNMQDIAHHALLKQLEEYEADHGCVIVMEVATGQIKAVSNLGKGTNGKYYERRNYALWESIEPGSTFKTVAMTIALEDKVIDTATVVDTKNGRIQMYGRSISDSKNGGYGKISAARALEVSSNIGFAKLINEQYKDQPQKFLDHLTEWKMDQPIGIPIKGEGDPVIPKIGGELWSRNALPSMAYGYNLQMTPLQTLTFYNALANDGEMVKPQFIKEIRAWNEVVFTQEKEVIDSRIASQKTIDQVRDILKNIVVRGTGQKLYSDNFSMAGKTGTARKEYANYEEWLKEKKYVSSFSGYFPAEDPKYSCIVVIHEPSTQKGYYGADVTGPVFKRIAQKIYTDSPLKDEVKDLESGGAEMIESYNTYFDKAAIAKQEVPNVKGMPAMDAITLLENLGYAVKVNGLGTVQKQSISPGATPSKGTQIVLTVS